MSGRSTHRQRRRAGFSLLELIVVLAILTTLAGVALPVATRGLARAGREATRSELGALDDALRAYFADTWRFPPEFEDLSRDRSGVAGWAGPYLLPGVSGAGADASLSTDAWGRAYRVRSVGDSRLEITSAGVDGLFGGEDDLALAVDVTPQRRARSLAELALIDTAIASWNRDRLPDEPLPDSVSGLLARLAQAGYLPDDGRLSTDGWGDAYIIWPADSSPVIGLESLHLLDAQPDDGDDWGPGNSRADPRGDPRRNSRDALPGGRRR